MKNQYSTAFPVWLLCFLFITPLAAQDTNGTGNRNCLSIFNQITAAQSLEKNIQSFKRFLECCSDAAAGCPENQVQNQKLNSIYTWAKTQADRLSNSQDRINAYENIKNTFDQLDYPGKQAVPLEDLDALIYSLKTDYYRQEVLNKNRQPADRHAALEKLNLLCLSKRLDGGTNADCTDEVRDLGATLFTDFVDAGWLEQAAGAYRLGKLNTNSTYQQTYTTIQQYLLKVKSGTEAPQFDQKITYLKEAEKICEKLTSAGCPEVVEKLKVSYEQELAAYLERAQQAVSFSQKSEIYRQADALCQAGQQYAPSACRQITDNKEKDFSNTINVQIIAIEDSLKSFEAKAAEFKKLEEYLSCNCLNKAQKELIETTRYRTADTELDRRFQSFGLLDSIAAKKSIIDSSITIRKKLNLSLDQWRKIRSGVIDYVEEDFATLLFDARRLTLSSGIPWDSIELKYDELYTYQTQLIQKTDWISLRDDLSNLNLQQEKILKLSNAVQFYLDEGDKANRAQSFSTATQNYQLASQIVEKYPEDLKEKAVQVEQKMGKNYQDEFDFQLKEAEKLQGNWKTVVKHLKGIYQDYYIQHKKHYKTSQIDRYKSLLKEQLQYGLQEVRSGTASFSENRDQLIFLAEAVPIYQEFFTDKTFSQQLEKVLTTKIRAEHLALKESISRRESSTSGFFDRLKKFEQAVVGIDKSMSGFKSEHQDKLRELASLLLGYAESDLIGRFKKLETSASLLAEFHDLLSYFEHLLNPTTASDAKQRVLFFHHFALGKQLFLKGEYVSALDTFASAPVPKLIKKENLSYKDSIQYYLQRTYNLEINSLLHHIRKENYLNGQYPYYEQLLDLQAGYTATMSRTNANVLDSLKKGTLSSACLNLFSGYSLAIEQAKKWTSGLDFIKADSLLAHARRFAQKQAACRINDEEQRIEKQRIQPAVNFQKMELEVKQQEKIVQTSKSEAVFKAYEKAHAEYAQFYESNNIASTFGLLSPPTLLDNAVSWKNEAFLYYLVLTKCTKPEAFRVVIGSLDELFNKNRSYQEPESLGQQVAQVIYQEKPGKKWKDLFEPFEMVRQRNKNYRTFRGAFKDEIRKLSKKR